MPGFLTVKTGRAGLVGATLIALIQPAYAQQVELESQREGLRIVAITELPDNPRPMPDETDCFGVFTKPQSPGATRVVSGAWGLTGEEVQGGMTFVSFVGRAENGTSGTCLLQDGNVGIFRGDQLVALVYAEAVLDRDIGKIRALPPAGIRIWDGDYMQAPLADLHVDQGGRITVGPIAKRDLFCDGDISLPSLFGLPILEARELLLEEGWQPAPSAEEPSSDWVREIAANGVPEVEDCAGTGFGQCRFSYTRQPAQSLGVITAGEWGEGPSPSVVDYGVSCD